MHKVLLVGSSGGHLAQLMALESWWTEHERRWVTFDTADAVSTLGGEQVAWAHHPTTRNLGKLLRNFWLAVRVMRDWRPDVVVSNGAAVAFPFFLVARALGVPTVYLEVYDRVDSRTLTGRLVHPIADLFLVQWPEQLSLYPGARLVGPML